MTEQNLYYSEYFHISQRAMVRLPLGNCRFFQEWAIISSAQADLVTLRLSRDMLPHTLQLEKGEPVSVRAGSGGQGYRCHAVIEDADLENLTLRLIGSIIPDELREFYRLDTCLGFDYAQAGMEDTWNRCIVGMGELAPESGNRQHSIPMELTGDNRGNGIRHAPLPAIVNISGGGVRAELAEEVAVGSLLNLAFHLPHPQPQPILTMAEVVYCHPKASVWSSGPRYITGMRYVRIQERNRDSIIKFVCSEEIKKIRSCNKEFHSLAAS